MNHARAMLVTTDEEIVQVYAKGHLFIPTDKIIICMAITFIMVAVGLFYRYRDKRVFVVRN